jgi:hypothetical protein
MGGPTVSFLDTATVKRTYPLWVGPTWQEERQTLRPESVFEKALIFLNI